jgi:hypothetical protein
MSDQGALNLDIKSRLLPSSLPHEAALVAAAGAMLAMQAEMSEALALVRALRS